MSSNLANTLESDEQSVPRGLVERRDEDTPVPPQHREVAFSPYNTPASQKSAHLTEPPAVVQRRPTTGDSGHPPTASPQSTISSHRITTPSPVHPPRRSPLLPLGNHSPAGFLSHHAAQHSTPKSASLGGAYLYGAPGFKAVHPHAKLNQLADMLVQATAQLEAEMGLVRELRAQCRQRMEFKDVEREGWCAQSEEQKRKIKELKLLLETTQRELTDERKAHEATKKKLRTADKRQEEAVNEVKEELKKVKQDVVAKANQIALLRSRCDEFRRQNVEQATQIERLKDAKKTSDENFKKSAAEVAKRRLDITHLKGQIEALKREREQEDPRLAHRPSALRGPSPAPRPMVRARSNSMQNLAAALPPAKPQPPPAVERNPDDLSEVGVFRVSVPGVGKFTYFASGQLAVDWNTDGLTDETTVFMQVRADGKWEDARMEIRRDLDMKQLFRETWVQYESGEIGNRLGPNGELERDSMVAADATPRRNPDVQLERAKDRLWKAAMWLQNQEFLRFEVPMGDGVVRITICRCGQEIRKNEKRLPYEPSRVAFNVKHLETSGAVRSLCTAVGECPHLPPIANVTH
ncbi:hypothetical protein M3Y99_00639600 [Aphelenchoides fujianensis]|nr:hypothetical protein M3Y99_00639600 [Aphelenchoides fujianensis]